MGDEEVGNVRVVARFRPFNSKELSLGSIKESEELFEFTDSSVKISNQKLNFALNRVVPKSTSQIDVYNYFGPEIVE